MFDIHFYERVFDLKKKLLSGQVFESSYVKRMLEAARTESPVVYNIETTNACNMRCRMCPRTTMMTRPIERLDMATYARIVEQLVPFSETEWRAWQTFVESSYGVPKTDMSENHFFLHVIPRVLVLHGYGDPLLDTDMPDRVKLLSEKNIPSYFSCNPANIEVGQMDRMFANGLGYVKFSVESVDDTRHKQIRGSASNFTESYRKILALLECKEKRGYGTTIVITMLNLHHREQTQDFERLKEAFKDADVYIYLKSQDQQWYQNAKEGTESIHWREFCQFPWSSMTIKSNGEAVMCVEDFNNAIVLGDAKQESLYDIWNGQRYRDFREDHYALRPGIKCTEQCDMRLIGSYLAVDGARAR